MPEKEPGLFCLKDRSSKTRFMLVTELSQIYKRDGKTHRVHNLIFAPSLEAVERVNAIFATRNFNLKSDGRPILGIDSENLYKLLKEIDDRIVLIPAHAWTPWYSVFGSKSGFDSLEECFGEMTPYIYAIETGLSSNPEMNWRLSALDHIVCISNSDAHSLNKLGREANVMEVQEPSYDEFMRILRERDRKAFLYTIEFFPEEGKYHYTGHRNCKVTKSPQQIKEDGSICSVCNRRLTEGVMYRVQQLVRLQSPEATADGGQTKQEKDFRPYNSHSDSKGVLWIDDPRKVHPSFVKLVPLNEIIAESIGSPV